MTSRATQISGHGRNRDDMRKDAKNLMNRLKSIKADSEFVSEIADLLPHFPVIANERCGTWYVHPSKIHKPGVYFKSTDGHTGRWDFNLRRYNPHLISTIIKNGGVTHELSQLHYRRLYKKREKSTRRIVKDDSDLVCDD
ncbi:hypothetical protein BGZ76_003194 [Entomortierella beljakovae]|nr:hypothetical protein BGZ76_003194 [Entomortierella beljakovae]